VLRRKGKELGVKMEIWSDEFNGAVTICNREGVIIYINRFAHKQFGKNAGEDLLGKNLLDCHPEPARSKLESMLKRPTINTYSIEKGGIKRIIHQTPKYTDGVFSGVIELSFDIPNEIPHFKRD
jgi:transcriptional regulator with PAS, ATPase and Fis domain